MNSRMRVCFWFAVSLVLCKGEQRCTENRTWPLYLDGIHCLLSSYYFQRDLPKFNVKDLQQWGTGGETGIHIDEANYELFLALMSDYNLCLDQRKLNQTQITALNSLLALILTQGIDIECRQETVTVTGTFLRVADLNFTDFLKGCSNPIKRVEIFASDAFYFNEDIKQTSEFHLNIAAPRWVMGKSARKIDLLRGNFLGIYEDFQHAKLTIETRHGKLPCSERDGVFFWEASKLTEATAENFAKTVQSFRVFMQERRKDFVLGERVARFLKKFVVNSYVRPSFIDKGILLSRSYAFHKNAKMLSLNFPPEQPDKKTQELLYAKMLTHVFISEDNSFNNLVVDMDAFLDSIINNLESVEKAYSVPLLKRIRYLKEDNRGKKIELSIVERYKNQFEIYLMDVIEGNLDFINAWNAEVDEEIAKLKNIDVPREFFLNYVKEVAGMLSYIPLLAGLPNVKDRKEFELRSNRLKYLTDDKRSSCEEVKKKMKNADGSDDLCGDFNMIGNIKLKIALSFMPTYATVETAFKDLQGLLPRVLKFVLKYCKKFGYWNLVHRVKVATEGVSEILALVSKYGHILKLEVHNGEAMSFEYENKEDLWQLGESDIVDVERGIGREHERRQQDIEVFKIFTNTSIFVIKNKFQNCLDFLREMRDSLVYIFMQESNKWSKDMDIAGLSKGLSLIHHTSDLEKFLNAINIVLFPQKVLVKFLFGLVTFPINYAVFGEWFFKLEEYQSLWSDTTQSWIESTNDFKDNSSRVLSELARPLEVVRNSTLDGLPSAIPIKGNYTFAKESSIDECIAKLMTPFKSLIHDSISLGDLQKFKFEYPKFHHEFFKLSYKLGSLYSDIASELVKFKKGRQELVLDKLPTYKDTALNQIKILKSIDSFTKLYTAPFEYNRLINAIKQYTFPLAHVYLTHHDLPTPINVNKVHILEIVKKFKYDFFKKGQKLRHEALKHSSVFGFKNFPPFYTWKDSQSIRNLLRGQEVVLIADLSQTNLNLHAVKFSTIGLNFNANVGLEPDRKLREESQKWQVKMTHEGDSLYSCDGKVYIIRTPAQKFSFSLALKEGTSEALITNSVYDKVRDGGYVLSPYATWKIRIYKGLNSEVTEDFMRNSDNITVDLVGRGQYYRDSPGLCSENLDEYYERVDRYRMPEIDGYFTDPLQCLPLRYAKVMDKTLKNDSNREVAEINY